jgi:hypothetical protein
MCKLTVRQTRKGVRVIRLQGRADKFTREIARAIEASLNQLQRA